MTDDNCRQIIPGVLSERTITDISGTAPYLVRWSLKLPFGWSIKLHQILRPDDDRCCHDHPWAMTRIILLRGYIEEHGPDRRVTQLKPWRPWAPWRVYHCPIDFRHRITALPYGNSWTLALCGPTKRKWGFFTKEGWVYWRDFVSQASSARALWCDDGTVLNGDKDEYDHTT